MTATWKPDLQVGSGPTYRRLRDAFVRDVQAARLQPGQMMPSQRQLADDLGISVGTVTRAFRILVEQGFLDARARSGSRVRANATTTAAARIEADATERGCDLRGHRALLSDWGETIKEGLLELTAADGLIGVLDYEPGPGRLSHREAGAEWLTFTAGSPCDAEEVVVCNGAQHALLCCLLSSSRAGDVIATETLTYSGLRTLAPTLDLNLAGVEIDALGLVPDSLDQLCRRRTVAGLVCVPNLHNPTTRTMPEERRERLIEVVERHGLFVIEDDVYGGMTEERLPTLQSLCPSHVMRIVGLSKTLGPGIRIGYVQAAKNRIGQLAGVLRATTWMASPIMAELASRLIKDGRAEGTLSANRSELVRRNTVLREALGGHNVETAAYSPHAWLHLPEPWTSKAFADWANTERILLLPDETFRAERNSDQVAVRISVSAAVNVEALEIVARTLVRGLADHPYNADIVA